MRNKQKFIPLLEIDLMGKKLDLDALIPRDEFAAPESNTVGDSFTTLSVKDLTVDFVYPVLRKPIFQRETNEWDAEKIADFLDSYLKGDLIPSIILWRSASGLIFVIDGAHRLSALLAWIKDDYGDKEISQKFYSYEVPEERKTAANNARKYINRRIGSYQEVSSSLTSTDAKPEHIKRAKGLTYAVMVQWIKDKNVRVAEDSFFRINQQGVALNPTEKKLLQARDKGNCIAARAISKGGYGFKYWSVFKAETQNNIESFAFEINELLFKPPLKNPVKSLDYLPTGGKNEASQALPLILDFVNISNSIPHDFYENIEDKKDQFPDDTDGEYCVSYLKKSRKTVWRINSIHSSSLGLHPAIYFYNLEGRHKAAALYAATAWVLQMEKENSFKDFIDVREDFENLLLQYDHLLQQINRKYQRLALKMYPHIKDFYVMCIKLLKEGKTIEETVKAVTESEEFNYLKIDEKLISQITTSDFSDESKSKVVLKKAIPTAMKCDICKGLIDAKCLTIDHIERKREGGKGTPENGQIAHPYCNALKN